MEMTRICRSPGCTAAASSRYSVYCPSHKARARRHGADDQRGISKNELKPYVQLVRDRITKNQKSEAWACLGRNWEAVVQHARGIIDQFARGLPGAVYELKAAQQAVRLAEAVPASDVYETAIAMYVMQELDPRRFRSDNAFQTQMVRRVRGLSDVNAGTYFDHRSSRTRRVYRDLTPRATAILAQWLVQAFGAAGIRVAGLERTEQERSLSERRAFEKAISEIN